MNQNGFLQRAPHGLRLSASQRRAVQRAMDAVFHHAKQKSAGGAVDVALLELSKLIVGRVLAQYPEDRSCHSCINFDPSDGNCSIWRQVVPPDARDAGCDRYLEDIPF